MRDLKTLVSTYARPGRIEEIWLRPARLAEPVSVQDAQIIEEGLSDDHARPGKRAVTLIQAEHRAVVGALLGQGPVEARKLRRNLVVSGINLVALKGRRVAVGGAVLEWTTVCAPCSRMEKALGEGGYSALRGHGGWCSRVLRPGRIAVGDRVEPLPDDALLQESR